VLIGNVSAKGSQRSEGKSAIRGSGSHIKVREENRTSLVEVVPDVGLELFDFECVVFDREDFARDLRRSASDFA